MGLHVVEVSHDLAEYLLGLLVKVGDDDPCRQDGVVRMLRRHRGSSFSREVVQLNGGDPIVDAADDLIKITIS